MGVRCVPHHQHLLLRLAKQWTRIEGPVGGTLMIGLLSRLWFHPFMDVFRFLFSFNTASSFLGEPAVTDEM